MRRTDIPSTKSNLLRLRQDFVFVRAGQQLLDQKREVLLEQLLEIARDAGQARARVEAALAEIYQALREALLAGGQRPVEAEALAAAGPLSLRVRERSVMGVVVPLIDLERTDEPAPSLAPGPNPVSAATVRKRVRELLPFLARLAEIEVSCRRLAAELQKTKRKVNALENIFIPEYRDTIRFIEGALEEKEREALFQLKRLKGRREAEPA